MINIFLQILTFPALWAVIQCVPTTNVAVDTHTVVNTVDDMFVGFTFDSGNIRWGFNLSVPRLVLLTKALTPAYFRIGGTSADYMTFTPTGPHVKHGPGNSFTMTAAQWDEINTFVKKTGMKMLFGLNVRLRKNGQWDPTNAKLLLHYSSQKGYPIAGFELGNEQNGHNKNMSAVQLATDVQELHRILQSTSYRSSMILGPDTAGYDKTYIRQYMSHSGSVVDVITFHQYYMNRQTATYDGFFKVSRLDHEIYHATSSSAIGRTYHRPVWYGETSTVSGGGLKNVSDSYTASFMWLDKLGIAARYGMKGVMRQDLIGGNYAVIDKATNHPNPDYWVTLLYKKLVGTRVFSVKSSSTNIRAYAYCTKHTNSYNYRAGSLTVFVLNVGDTSAQINFVSTSHSADHIDAFILAPYGGNMYSKGTTLNGHHLVVHNNQLPHLNPAKLSGHATMLGKRLGFFVLTNANVAACKTHHGAIIG